MDDISCVASAFALLQLTQFVLKLAHKHSGPSRFKNGALQGILQRLYALNGCLSSLKTHLEINEADEARLQTLNHLTEPLSRCKDALELIKD
jgi:hypothetical protein